MKLIKKEYVGTHPVYSTNVNDNHNYITNTGIINANCVIDEDYEGEIHLSLVNTGDSLTEISEHEKIVQFILIPVNYSYPVEVYIKNLYNEFSERGEGGFGSTDNKK